MMVVGVGVSLLSSEAGSSCAVLVTAGGFLCSLSRRRDIRSCMRWSCSGLYLVEEDMSVVLL